MTKLTKGQKRFSELVDKCLFPNGKPADYPPSPHEDVHAFLVAFDAHMKEFADERGLELRHDHDDPAE